VLAKAACSSAACGFSEIIVEYEMLKAWSKDMRRTS
jgi:hypothetical protein